jgi:hypothetical protein
MKTIFPFSYYIQWKNTNRLNSKISSAPQLKRSPKQINKFKNHNPRFQHKLLAGKGAAPTTSGNLENPEIKTTSYESLLKKFTEMEEELAKSPTMISEKLIETLPKELQYAYFAGLMEGDGSIYCLLADRTTSGYKFGYEIRPCASITQRREKKHVLEHANRIVDGLGTLRDRNDGICAVDFHGKDRVTALLPLVKPYLSLKSKQAKLVLHIIKLMPYCKDDPQKFLNLCRIVDRVSAENDGNNLKNTSETVKTFLLSRGFNVV